MKQAIMFAGLLYLVLVLDAGLATDFAVKGFQPSFLAVMLVWSTAAASGNGAVLRAAATGLAGDALRGEILGPGMLLAVLAVWASHWRRDEKTKTRSIGLRHFFSLAFYLISLDLVLMLLEGKIDWWPTVLLHATGTTLYSGIILLLLPGCQKAGQALWTGTRQNMMWR